MNKKIIQRISLLILLFVLPVVYPVNDIHAQDVRVTIRMDKVRPSGFRYDPSKYNHLPKYLLHLPIIPLIVFKYLL